MSLSDSSGLSSPPSTDDEAPTKDIPKPSGLNRYFKPTAKGTPKVPSSPPPPKRPASPPHEYVLADSPDIAFIVMFRSRFHNAFPKSVPHYGPQDIERGIESVFPGENVEKLLCALLGLVLNRKKDVERGHFHRALEEAIQSHRSHWPTAWNGKNPTHNGVTFASMAPEERLILLKTLILWSLSSSEAVQVIVKDSYKQVRHEDDRNQPLSVQPWGRDGYKRRYWLIEGQDDTSFRLYRENNGITSKTNQWFSVADSIEEVKRVAEMLDEEGTPHARTLRDRIRAAVPRFESGEEKRRRRDYRLARKSAFTRPEPGFSLYEGRTRGKRIRYTFSDDEDDSDTTTTNRAVRNSGISSPAEHAGPTITTSGRQVKSRLGGMYGETMLVDQRKGLESEREAAVATVNAILPERDQGTLKDRSENGSRPRRIIRAPRKIDDSSEEEAGRDSRNASSENEWSGHDEPDGAEEFEADDDDDDDDTMNEDATGENRDGNRMAFEEGLSEQEHDSLVVQLRYKGQGRRPTLRDQPEADDPMVEDCIAVDGGLPPQVRKPEITTNGYVRVMNGGALHDEEGETKSQEPHPLGSPNALTPSPGKATPGSSRPVIHQQPVQL